MFLSLDKLTTSLNLPTVWNFKSLVFYIAKITKTLFLYKSLYSTTYFIEIRRLCSQKLVWNWQRDCARKLSRQYWGRRCRFSTTPTTTLACCAPGWHPIPPRFRGAPEENWGWSSRTFRRLVSFSSEVISFFNVYIKKHK